MSELLKRQLMHRPERKAADSDLRELAEGASSGKPLNWEIVERLVEIDPKKSLPPANHGTHVAGITRREQAGATARRSRATGPTACARTSSSTTSACWRPTLEDTEFAIIAALQYIRYLNERNSFITIHGANLSLSIPHDVRNYACGRTPVCDECERLVESGVVVVAAAGNRGYQNFETQGRLVRGLRRLQHHRPRQRRRRHHGRRDASLLAAHLRRQLLLEPRTDRRRPHEARSRRARRAHPRAVPRQATGAISTAPAWPRRTSAARRRC